MYRRGRRLSQSRPLLDDLLKALWKVDSKEVDTRAVDDMVKRLRKKMKEQNSAVKIETVWGYAV